MLPELETPEQRESREAAELDRLRELDDLREVMATPAGRRHTWRQLGRSGMFRQVFSGEETHRTAFADGNRMHGLKLFADIMEAMPERYAEMMTEAAKAERGDTDAP